MARKLVLLSEAWAVVTMLHGRPLTVQVYADRDIADKAAGQYPENRYVLPTSVIARPSQAPKNVTPRRTVRPRKALPAVEDTSGA